MGKTLLALACLIAVAVPAQAKTYTGSYTYRMSSDKSEDEAKDYAKAMALRGAVEKAGVYVATYAQQRNFRMETHEVTVFTKHIAKILDTSYTNDWRDNILYIKATVKATVDEKELEKRIREFGRDRQAYERALKRYTETNEKLERKVEALEQKLKEMERRSTRRPQESHRENQRQTWSSQFRSYQYRGSYRTSFVDVLINGVSTGIKRLHLITAGAWSPKFRDAPVALTTRLSYGQVENHVNNPYEFSWDIGIGTDYRLYGESLLLIFHGGLSLRGDNIKNRDEPDSSVGVYGAYGLSMRLTRRLSFFVEGEWIKYTNQGYVNFDYLNTIQEGEGFRFGISFHPRRN